MTLAKRLKAMGNPRYIVRITHPECRYIFKQFHHITSSSFFIFTQIRFSLSYIRLTNLITPILDMVDEKRMAMGPAVELSYLNRDEQEMLLDLMQIGDCTPSLSQAIRLRKLSEAGQFDPDRLDEIIDEEKPNQREKVTFRLEDLVPYFPESSVEEIRDIIMKLIEREVKRRRKERSDDRDR